MKKVSVQNRLRS